MDTSILKSNLIHEFKRLKEMTEKAVAQVSDDDFFKSIDKENNSIAITIKHIAGNMRSRWRDFLTSDGEKPDRYRDNEFIIDKEDSRVALMKRWEEGWKFLFEAIEPLTDKDSEAIVYIRKEEFIVIKAINRQLSHYAYHVGQIVQLTKHFCGSDWQTLSIPRGESETFNAKTKKYLADKMNDK
ncbi:MAG: DUF1572 family protein [bacterium]